MTKASVLTILFGVIVILSAVALNALVIDEVTVVPEVQPILLEQLRPEIEQSFVEDLRERSKNSVGIELEL